MPAARMKELLQTAGIPAPVIAQVQSVVDTCRICRNWTDTMPKAVLSGTVIPAFNEEVKFDLVFWKVHIVLHSLEPCIRFAAGNIITDRNTETIHMKITMIWFRVCGPPKRFVSDHEGALDSDEGRQWATRWGVDLQLRPRGGHARLIERYNVLRDTLHRVDDQLTLDGIHVPAACIVAVCVVSACWNWGDMKYSNMFATMKM